MTRLTQKEQEIRELLRNEDELPRMHEFVPELLSAIESEREQHAEATETLQSMTLRVEHSARTVNESLLPAVLRLRAMAQLAERALDPEGGLDADEVREQLRAALKETENAVPAPE